MPDVQVWGGGPFDNGRASVTLGAFIIKLAEDLGAEIKHLERRKVAEQEAVALVKCLNVLLKFDEHRSMGPPRWKAEAWRDRFQAWFDSANNKIPQKWRAATLEMAQREFKTLIARCPFMQEGVE